MSRRWIRVKVIRLRTKRGRPWVCRWIEGSRARQEIVPRRFRKSARARELFRASLENRINGLEQPATESPTLKQALAAFLDSRRLRGRSDDTVRIYKSLLERFIENVGDRPAGMIRPADIERHLARPSARKDVRDLAPATRHKEHNHIRVFFRWLARQGHIERSPVDGVDAPPAPKGRPEAYTDAEARRILAEAHTRRPWAETSIRLALLCGLRAGELESVAAADVDFEARLLRVPAQKSARQRTVHFDEETGGLLHELAYRGDHLLWGPADGPFLRAGTFRRNLVAEARRVLAAAGVRRAPEPAKPLQMMRRTFGSIIARTVSPEVLGAVMGHVSTQTTRDFYIDPQALEAARAAQVALGNLGDLAHGPASEIRKMGDPAGDLDDEKLK